MHIRNSLSSFFWGLDFIFQPPKWEMPERCRHDGHEVYSMTPKLKDIWPIVAMLYLFLYLILYLFNICKCREVANYPSNMHFYYTYCIHNCQGYLFIFWRYIDAFGTFFFTTRNLSQLIGQKPCILFWFTEEKEVHNEIMLTFYRSVIFHAKV